MYKIRKFIKHIHTSLTFVKTRIHVHNLVYNMYDDETISYTYNYDDYIEIDDMVKKFKENMLYKQWRIEGDKLVINRLYMTISDDGICIKYIDKIKNEIKQIK